MLYVANPSDACRKINPPSPKSGQNYFLLVDDGGCGYYDKVFVICCCTIDSFWMIVE
jgi:hypothetical protein